MKSRNKIAHILKFVLWSALFFMFIRVSLYSAENEMVAIVTSVNKKVDVKRVGTDIWNRIKVRDYLYEGDRIKAGKDAHAEVSFISGVGLYVKENTEIEIRETDSEVRGKDTSIELFKGKLFNRVKKLSNLEIRTPQAVAAVRGTEFGVEVGDITRIYVIEGLVDVWNSQGRVELKEGMETTVEAGQAPEEPSEIDSDKRKEEEKETKVNLKLSILGDIVAGEKLKMGLSVVDRNGNLKSESVDKVRIESAEELFISNDGSKWDKLPYNLKMDNGKANFYIRSLIAQNTVVSFQASEAYSTVVELIFASQDERELIIDVDDEGKSRRLKFFFEKQE